MSSLAQRTASNSVFSAEMQKSVVLAVSKPHPANVACTEEPRSHVTHVCDVLFERKIPQAMSALKSVQYSRYSKQNQGGTDTLPSGRHIVAELGSGGRRTLLPGAGTCCVQASFLCFAQKAIDVTLHLTMY